jgi:hypothetical protein
MTKRATAGNMEKSSNYNGNDIYSCSSDGSFYSPFSLKVDDMEHLLLINFEKDPDKFYNVFELQQASSKEGHKYLLVIAYRVDGGADVYQQSGYPLASQAIILNDVTFSNSPLEGARFTINDERLDIFFAFEDKYGREVRVKIDEERQPGGKPFFLLAPIGTVAREPKTFPVYSLYGMAFIKQKHAHIEIVIDRKRHKPDTFPLPIDCSRNYFSRFAADTFNVDWNRNFNGRLSPLLPDENNLCSDGQVTYELANNCGHHEIKRMSTANARHRIDIDFQPPVPDMLCIKDQVSIEGEFIITTDRSTGTIRGSYSMKRLGNEAEVMLHLDKGWSPNNNRIILKLLFLMVRVFADWPKSYRWTAKIKLDTKDHPYMNSGWERIKK